MKVIHFVFSVDKSAGGTAVYMQLLSNELKERIQLYVVTGQTSDPVDLNGIKTIFFDLKLIKWFALKRQFLKFLSSEMPDIVHINGIWTPQNWLFQKVAQQLGIKVILSPHGMLEPYILNRHPFRKKIGMALYQHRALKSVDFFHATAKSELEQIRKLGYGQSAQVIANGIEIGDVKLKTEWRSVQSILFLSRIHPKKGIEILIEAIAQLNIKHLKVIVAGEGDRNYIDSLKKLTVEKNIANQFDFIGGVYGDEKWYLYKSADIFVLPTYSENFGIVIPEALATGLPVITTTGTPWSELDTFKCGWWIDLNVQNLINALDEAINKSPEEIKQMGLNGRKLVNETYDIKAIGYKMIEYYSHVLKIE